MRAELENPTIIPVYELANALGVQVADLIADEGAPADESGPLGGDPMARGDPEAKGY